MRVTTKGHAPAPLQEAGKQQGMAKSVEELGKQLDALQARVVAAEEENKKLRENAETAGPTTTGTAGRAERFNVQGVSGDSSGVTLSFSSVHRRDGSDFPDGGVGQQHGSWNRHHL